MTTAVSFQNPWRAIFGAHNISDRGHPPPLVYHAPSNSVLPGYPFFVTGCEFKSIQHNDKCPGKANLISLLSVILSLS